MKKLVSLIFALALCASLSIPAFATDVLSNQGGNGGDKPTAPRTGSVAAAVLPATACAAGGLGAITYKKSKD